MNRNQVQERRQKERTDHQEADGRRDEPENKPAIPGGDDHCQSERQEVTVVSEKRFEGQGQGDGAQNRQKSDDGASAEAGTSILQSHLANRKWTHSSYFLHR